MKLPISQGFFGKFLFIFATKSFLFPRLLDHKLIKLILLLYQK